MKERRYNWPGAIIVLASVGLVIFLALEARKCSRQDKCPPEGKELVNSSYMDSLRAVASRSPDTVMVEKIVVKDTTIYIIRKKPEPVFVNLPENTRVYVDSVKMLDNGINAWVRIRSLGIVDEIMWGYKPVYKTVTRTITIPKPYPVFRDQSERGLFVEGGVGWGGGPGVKVGLKWQQRNGLTYGAEVAQFKNRYYLLTVGYKLF